MRRSAVEVAMAGRLSMEAPRFSEGGLHWLTMQSQGGSPHLARVQAIITVMTIGGIAGAQESGEGHCAINPDNGTVN